MVSSVYSTTHKCLMYPYSCSRKTMYLMSRNKQEYSVAIGTRSTIHHAMYWAFGHHMIGVQAEYTSKNCSFTNQIKFQKSLKHP